MAEAPGRLSGKTVLVTGASSGIGRAIAVRCASEGADLAITYRGNRRGGEETAEAVREVGRRAELLQADVSRDGDVETLASSLTDRFERTDVWINNAGADILTGEGGKLSRLEKLDRVLAVDLRGTAVASWAAVDLMRRQGGGGTIINLSWDHVTLGLEGENPMVYSAAKGGIMSFSKSLAREVAPEIRVNVLAPGFIQTAFGDSANQRWIQSVIDRTPLRRWGLPEDLAGAAAFLASDDASFMTGQMLMVNGGVVM